MSSTLENPLAASLFQAMPPADRASFSPSQCAALDKAAAATRTSHTLDYRVSLPSLTGPGYYVVLLAGRERRNPLRLAAEGQTRLDRRSLAFVVLLLLLGVSGLFGALLLAYLIKTMLGIDFSLSESFLHPLLDVFS